MVRAVWFYSKLPAPGHSSWAATALSTILTLSAGQKYTVDTGHIIAFSEKLGFKVRKVGGLKSTLLSGEGLVVDLTGPGRVLLQTRSTEAFLAWLIPLLPKTKDQPIVEK